MVTFNLAYTAPVNAATLTPKLTAEQLWAGLERKVKHAQEFVPIIVKCKVVSEETRSTGELVVTRQAAFKGENGAEPREVTEVCVHYAPTRIDFKQEDGSCVSNIVSRGSDGELQLTYCFEWRHSAVASGSDEAKLLEEKYWKIARMAIEGSIITIRKLVEAGEIV